MIRRHMPVVLEVEHLRDVVKHFERQDHFYFDVESIGEAKGVPAKNELAWISLATNGMDVAIPMRHPIGDVIIGETKEPRADKNGKIRHFTVPVWEDPPKQLRPSTVFELLDPLFSSDRLKGAHSFTFDGVAIAKYRDGRPPAPPYHCSLTSSWLLDENRLNGLKALTKAIFGSDYDPGKTGANVASTPFSKAAWYSAYDSRFGRMHMLRNIPRLTAEGLDGAFRMEMDLLTPLMEMAITGAPIDMPSLYELRDHLEKLLERQEADVYRAAGRELNLNSAQQVAALLYGPKSDGGLGLRPKTLTDGGKKKKRARKQLEITDYSTDADTLKEYAGIPVIDAMLEFKETDKLLGTYVYGYLGDPTKKDRPCQIFDERIHTQFLNYGTVTGRFSSMKPNLQNIPRPSTDLGKRVRGLFKAPPGYRMIVADYGQIELVLFAHFAGPGALYDGFQAGIDPHTTTAAGILKIAAEAVTGEQRQLFGKKINFVVGFGGQADLLAKEAQIPLKEAEENIAAHKRSFPEIYAYKRKLIETARSRADQGCFIRTLVGRKRRVPDLVSNNKYWRLKAERQIVNSHIQGSAADLIKIAMIRAKALLPEEAKLILTVHDELVTLVPEHLVEEAEEAIREAMTGEGIQSLISVPLTCDIKIVDRWADAK